MSHTCYPSAGDIEAGLQANGIFGLQYETVFFPASDLANPTELLPLRPCLQLYLLLPAVILYWLACLSWLTIFFY